MATLYGDQYSDAFVEVPSTKIRRGDQSGEIKFLRWDYTISAASVPSNSDIIKLARLPKGATMIEALVNFTDLAGTGNIDVGWAASTELDSAGSAVVAADADGMFDNIDLDTAADVVLMSQHQASPAGINKQFGAEVELQILVNDAWSATTGTLNGWIMYVVY